MSNSRYALLGMLARGPRSGYEIKKFIGESIAHFWNESYGQIYPMLKQLQSERLAVPRRSRRRGGRERYSYLLTPKGLQELKAWLGAPVKYQTPRSELLLKIFFGRHTEPSELVHHVQRFREYHIQLLRTYEAIGKQLPRATVGDDDLPYWLMTLSFGRLRSRAFVQWSDEALHALARLAGRKRSRNRH